MKFLRRARKSSILTDYRKVSDSVHALRVERVRNPETLREDPETTRAAVRTYRPEERLRAVDRETRQLVEDSSDIPREWDSDFAPPPPPGKIRLLYWVILALHLLTAIAMFVSFFSLQFEDATVLAWSTLFTGVLLLLGAIYYQSQLRGWAWVGFCLGIMEFVFTAIYLR